MTKPFTIDDLYRHRKVETLHTVPGLDTAIGTVRSVDREADKYATHLWRFALDGSDGRPLTFGNASDTFARLSPDGRQVDAALRGRRSEAPPLERRPGAAEVAWRLPYKEDGMGYVLAREIHLFSLEVGSGEQRRLSNGPFDVMNFDISADGARIACVRTREGRYAHCFDVWVFDRASERHQRVTFDHAMAMYPAWSPDGDRIAFTGAIEEADAEPRLWIADLATGAVEELGGDDVDVGDPETLRWSADDAGRTKASAMTASRSPASLTAGS